MCSRLYIFVGDAVDKKWDRQKIIYVWDKKCAACYSRYCLRHPTMLLRKKYLCRTMEFYRIDTKCNRTFYL